MTEKSQEGLMDTRHRTDELRRYMEGKGIAFSLVTNPDNQFYLSGFKAVIYSRPIHLVIAPEKTSLIVPALEEVHAETDRAADEVLVYYEHPEMAEHGTSHLQHLDRLASRCRPGSRFGIELGSAPFALVEHLRSLGLQPVDIGRKITEMRFIKDSSEVELMIEAGRLVSLAVRESLSAARAGITEIDLDARGTSALFDEVAARHQGSTLDFFVMSPSGVVRTVMPHVFSNARTLETGDVIIHSRQVALRGYRGECERTCFIGRPTREQEHAFHVAAEAQEAALDIIQPGIPMADVDRAAREIIQKAGFGQYFIHRTGHGIGISSHEEPSLRFDELMLAQEGMAFSIEPAVFIPGIGGFRHSDTVILTPQGKKIVTDYPRDLESLVF
jgi:Xaa-Pro dipeptidase